MGTVDVAGLAGTIPPLKLGHAVSSGDEDMEASKTEGASPRDHSHSPRDHSHSPRDEIVRCYRCGVILENRTFCARCKIPQKSLAKTNPSVREASSQNYYERLDEKLLMRSTSKSPRPDPLHIEGLVRAPSKSPRVE